MGYTYIISSTVEAGNRNRSRKAVTVHKLGGDLRVRGRISLKKKVIARN